MTDIGMIWEDYGLDRLDESIQTLFPGNTLSLEELLGQLMQGDVFGALGGLFSGVIKDVAGQFTSMRNVFIWLLVLGIVSSLMTRFVEVFDRHQVADLGFYFMYLLFSAVLLKCFFLAGDTALKALEQVILFIKLMIPAYLMSVGVTSGAATAGASAQIMLVIIYGIENILIRGLVPFIYSMCMLAVINGVWVEERLAMLIDLLEKGVGLVLKGAIWAVTGLSVFQSLITPVLDTVRKSALRKVVSAIPGVGSAADGVVEMVLGSAEIIKNSIGVALLLLFLFMCALPLIKIVVIAGMLKCAAAFMGIVSDKRITACANRTGDAGFLLFRTAGAAMLLFVISVAVITAAS